MTHFVACFFAGLFAFNAVPHLVAGMQGHRHKTPFVRLTKTSDSSATLNVHWAFVNLAVAWVLVMQTALSFSTLADAGVFAAGGLLIGSWLSVRFAKKA